MTKLTELELQNLKSLIELQDTNYQKLSNYADYAVDPQIKQIFTKAAQDSLSIKKNLISFLE